MVEQNFAGSVNAGAPAGPDGSNESGRLGELQIGNMNYTEKDILELQQKLSSQGEELGQYRQQFDKLTPLLEKLQDMPEEFIDAIVDGKITEELAKAVVKGEVSPEAATAASKAHEEIKQELGDQYKEKSPEEINKLLEKKVDDLLKKAEDRISSRLSEAEQERELEEKTLSFIKNTPDYLDYAEEIEKYLDENDLLDVRIAYDAVKGKVLSEKIKKESDDAATEKAKELVANMAGGGSMSSGVINDENLIDKILPLKNVGNIKF